MTAHCAKIARKLDNQPIIGTYYPRARFEISDNSVADWSEAGSPFVLPRIASWGVRARIKFTPGSPAHASPILYWPHRNEEPPHMSIIAIINMLVELATVPFIDMIT